MSSYNYHTCDDNVEKENAYNKVICFLIKVLWLIPAQF